MRRITARFWFSAVLTAVVAAGAAPADAAGSGSAFTLGVRATGSARAAFREAVGALRGGPLANLAVRSAFSDRNDRFVQGFFGATAGGAPVEGVLFAGTGGVAGVVLDTPERLPRSYASLVQRLQRMVPARSAGAGSAAARPLHNVSFGSGNIGLPDGWSVINSYQGCVEAGSTVDHGYIALGCPQHATVPPGLPGTNPRAQLVAPFSSPVQILATIMMQPSPVGLGLQAFRAREVQPVASGLPNGRAAYVLFDYRANGAPYRGLALISIAPIDSMSFLVYKSMFMLPAQTFPQLAPTMWRSWQSWGVSSGVLTGRLTAAAQSMRETGDIITGAYWDRQHANSTAAAGFDQYIRDSATLEHIGSGDRAEGPWADAQAIVNRDPTRWRIVPTAELIPR
ncbi:MAG: hypothetical protein QOF71_1827 [Candidatus Eremiobacteraeota bacterium]|jgi:hypothetical protein|nr:hypothetical protein [Candidatus Eremiobacteraeota bacterium]